jgi:hypothetical protein
MDFGGEATPMEKFIACFAAVPHPREELLGINLHEILMKRFAPCCVAARIALTWRCPACEGSFLRHFMILKEVSFTLRAN